MEAIRCEALRKRYGDILALDNLNLVVPEGLVFGFLGPNGAGKTTTLKLLTGLSAPSGGRAWVAGEEVRRDAVSLRSKIGYLPEESNFYNWMTGSQFLTYVGELFHLPSGEIKRRCEEFLELVELKEVANRKIGGYSRGMKQRLGIAQALINHPQVLILDEPCSALDPMGRREILSLIRRLRGQATVFMSSHILADVERVCDAVGIIDRGNLLLQSPIEELRRQYARFNFELRFEEDVSSLVTILRSMPWVVKVEVETAGDLLAGDNIPTVGVRVRDLNMAKQLLPRLIADSGLTLLHYELTLPTLEDIFVELVGNRGE